MLWSTVSKAADKSVCISALYQLLKYLSCVQSLIVANAVVVLCNFLDPWWLLSIMSCVSRKSVMQSFKCCSTNFSIDDKLLIGQYDEILKETLSGLSIGVIRLILNKLGNFSVLIMVLINLVMYGTITGSSFLIILLILYHYLKNQLLLPS